MLKPYLHILSYVFVYGQNFELQTLHENVLYKYYSAISIVCLYEDSDVFFVKMTIGFIKEELRFFDELS